MILKKAVKIQCFYLLFLATPYLISYNSALRRKSLYDGGLRVTIHHKTKANFNAKTI